MKEHILPLLTAAITALQQRGVLGQVAPEPIQIEHARDPKHGDFASNIALQLAATINCPPRELAAQLIAQLPPAAMLAKTEIAGPGFINFYLAPTAYYQLITDIRHAAETYGHTTCAHDHPTMVEFVSTNPTGPLHVGHGRGAAYGDALVRVLTAVGYRVHREYYINDGGRQMDILALSVWLRYLEHHGATITFPANGYQGDYIRTVARDLTARDATRFCIDTDLPADLTHPVTHTDASDGELAIDAAIAAAKAMLGERYEPLFTYACAAMVADIRDDLAEFGVTFEQWFSEHSLVTNGDIARAIEVLEAHGHLYEKQGARWFRATAFGDEKDRVVVRANGVHTYFAADIAYHHNKATRGFEKIINIFGADHHGYIGRIQAAFAALGHDPARLQFILVQFAVLYRGQEKISMSTRAGEFVSLRALREEVGNDAARFFYVLRKPDQHLDFDLELARTQSADNPVYYIQYAHARICSVFRMVAERGLPSVEATADYSYLTEAAEFTLLKLLARFPECVATAAANYEPHQIAYYLRNLATQFHHYYNAHPFLASTDAVRTARLGLIDAIRIVIANGLQLLGVTAPTEM